MKRFLKAALPYVAAVVGAVVIFAAGAYSALWFTGSFLNTRLGQRELSELAEEHMVLLSLDAGNSEQGRSLLISEEDTHLMTLDMLSPYLADDLANSTCRIIRAVAKRRADNASKYAATGLSADPEVQQMIAASLQRPASCARASGQ